jgi:hypothetical protein
MGRREILHTFLLLVEIEGHFTHELVSYVYETQDRSKIHILYCSGYHSKKIAMRPTM